MSNGHDNGLKDALAAFGVWSAIVVIWQFVEYHRTEAQAQKDRKELRERLTRIEGKLK